MKPETRYARSGDLHIAYQVVGEGPIDLVLVPGFISHLELAWEAPPNRRFFERLASFSRLILFDKRGMGLSDPVPDAPTLEQRMDDVRAVMDAAGSERAVLFGVSEGAPMSILFAATYPDRVGALVIHGGMARSTEAPDYPFAPPAEAIKESMKLLGPHIYEGATVEIFQASQADDPATRESAGRFLRNAASPAMMTKISQMFLDIDVRDVLPSVRVPTLVIHRHGDRAVAVQAGRWLASHIEGARFVELPGIDHLPFAGDQDAVLDEVERFLTGSTARVEPDRVLATVMLTDIVASTERANAIGDRAWRELLEAHQTMVRAQLERFRGVEVKTLGDGFMARFDGPARAIHCANAIVGGGEALGLPTRVGIHTGECELMGEDVGGIAVHIAFRVSDMAAAGEVLVSRTVKDLVAGSGIKFEDKGTHALKGISETWQLFAVAGERG